MKKPVLLGCVALLATTPAIANAFAASASICGGPQKGWRIPKDGIPELATVVDVSTDFSGDIYWNGKTISKKRFAEFLRAMSNREDRAFVVFKPNELTDCSVVHSMRSQMEKALKCSKGNCGESSQKPGEINPWIP